MSLSQHTNHLADQSSPYLLSHAHNPVDWYPWGEIALKRAKAENKPIFLSIGYSACHWCHVMERESFENEEIAAILNEHYIAIKVDREERPDLDHIYMTFTQALSGSGGWPMSVFLTPDLRPFFAGTYFPPDNRYGRPGFAQVISEIAAAWQEQREQLVQSSKDIADEIWRHLKRDSGDVLLSRELIPRGVASVMGMYDPVHGGLGGAPKFPHPLELSLLLRQYKATGDMSLLNAAEKSLLGMARGGIYDQLGGGFARYATDRAWLGPHFEKMLYDNALLVPVYAEAWQITGNETYRRVVRETLDFLLREMCDPAGGFYSALDADSEGKEGRFYVWTKAEIETVLGGDASAIIRYYNVTDRGNFEGHNILHLTGESDRVRAETADFEALMSRSRAALMAARSQRIRPNTDDKILTSWNGLALTALCKGYQITRDDRYLKAAIDNGRFVRDTLFRDGKLIHSWRAGKYSTGLFLEDYSFYLRGLLDLYETDTSDNNEQWLTFAVHLADQGLNLFMDDFGVLYLREPNQPDLIMRPRDEEDGAIPSSGSLFIGGLFRLNRLTGNEEYLHAAEKSLRHLSGKIGAYSSMMTSALFALDYWMSDKVEIVIVGDGPARDDLLDEIWKRYRPNRIVVSSRSGQSAICRLFEGRTVADGEVKVFVCRNSACRLPVNTVEDLRKQLDGL
ncbi:MAG: thioredoxin domain-containing protein [candidate division Zixibacteria bacterium]|nr:thioredoxin domain-containing protein [candidate division Zixibacteria bacterium]